jgi:KDO2-lipid IV(A) lauroyltransferase
MNAALKRLRHGAEYSLTRLAWAAFQSLPYPLCAALARGLGDAAFVAAAARRRIAIDNLLRSSLGLPAADARRTARASFRHFALCALEAVKLQPLFVDSRWRPHFDPDAALANLEAVRDRPGGVILAAAHFGSWELGASVFASYRPLTAIARPMDNPRVDAFLTQRRFHGRVRAVPKHGDRPRRLVELLRSGAALAVMIDTNAGRHGVPLDFLGRPAPTYESVARLQLATDAPVYFGYCRRTGPLAYALGLLGPFACPRTDNRAADTLAFLRQMYAELERLIRRNPEQYLWAHRRWKFPKPRP